MSSRATTIALATAAALPDGDDDVPGLVAALRARGLEAAPAVWDDPAVDWSRFDAVVVRSTWDYPRRPEAFLAWADAVEARTRLFNPAAVLRWNTDKRYLQALATAGVPVVPTTFVAPGEALPALEGDVVIKPTVSAGSIDTERFAAGDRGAAAAHLARLHATGRIAMVQPYVDGVDRLGETALIFIRGRFSHAIRKGPILTGEVEIEHGLSAREEISRRGPSEAEREVARRVLAAMTFAPETLLYARVDLVPGPDGEPLLIELELTEPSLFLGYADGAAELLAAAIVEVGS